MQESHLSDYIYSYLINLSTLSCLIQEGNLEYKNVNEYFFHTGSSGFGISIFAFLFTFCTCCSVHQWNVMSEDVRYAQKNESFCCGSSLNILYKVWENNQYLFWIRKTVFKLISWSMILLQNCRTNVNQ